MNKYLFNRLTTLKSKKLIPKSDKQPATIDVPPLAQPRTTNVAGFTTAEFGKSTVEERATAALGATDLSLELDILKESFDKRALLKNAL